VGAPVRLSPSHIIGVVGNIVVFVGTREPAPAMAQDLIRALRDCQSQYPSGIGYLHIADPEEGSEVGRMNDATRRAFIEAIRVAEQPKAALLVVTRKGLMGSIIRGTMSGMVLAARLPMPVKIAGSVDDGLTWLLEMMRKGGATPPLAASVSTLIHSLMATLKQG
jgi:hypothetical protein